MTRKTESTLFALLFTAAYICCVGIFLCSCSALPTTAQLRTDATTVYPRTVAALDQLNTLTKDSGSSPVGVLGGAFCCFAIGALGIWARITHGQVAGLVADNKASLATTPTKENAP
jgi:hypothetical protein